MKLLVVNHQEVGQLLPMNECLEVMVEVFQALALCEAVNPLRSVLPLPGREGFMVSMPAYLGPLKTMGLKILSVFPENHGKLYPSHQGAVILFETEHGQPLAIIEAGAITAVRTAAVSGLATRLLALPEAKDLAILGAGVQAGTHLEAMMAVRPIKRVRVWSRTPAHGRQFADLAEKHYKIRVELMATAQEAVMGADLICTTTAAEAPVLKGDWLSPGAHINAVGIRRPASTRELDTLAVVRSRLFVDLRESALSEAGDFLLAKQEGAIDDRHILGELGDILIGRVAGRRSPEEITLFKSLGLAVEDLAAANYIYYKAQDKGLGVFVDL